LLRKERGHSVKKKRGGKGRKKGRVCRVCARLIEPRQLKEKKGRGTNL